MVQSVYPRRLSIPNHVALLTAAFAVIICIIAGLVFAAVRDMRDEANRIDDVRASHAANAAIRSFKARLGSTVRDNAFWDDAFRNIGSADAESWAYENWGKASDDYPLYDVAVVLTPSRGVISAYRKGAEFEPFSYFGDNLADLASRAAIESKQPVTGFLKTVDGIYLVAAGAIQPFTDTAPGGNFSTLIFAKLLTPDVLTQLQDTFDIGDLTIVTSLRPGQLSMPLVENTGRVAGYLEWPSRMPGSQIYSTVSGYLILAGLLFVSFVLAIVATAVEVVRGLRRDADIALFKASHDGLTGLLNRAGLLDAIDAVDDASGVPIALALIDLDGFKEVNDAWGHAIGDELIRLVADRVKTTVASGRAISRLGGDEFAFVSAAQDIAKNSEAVIHALQEPFRIGGRTIEVGASIGTAVLGSEDVDGFESLRRADMALYEAKNNGRGRVVEFSAVLDIERHSRAALEEKLRQAIERQDIRPAFQPLVDAKTGSLRGVEALARWSPDTGPVSPEIFIAVAERAGLIDQLGRQILEVSIDEASSWGRVGLSVNVSPVQLRNPEYASVVEKILQSKNFDADRLTLEITEGVLMSNPDQAKRTIARLQAIGVKFALDDFGCGYASIGTLREFGFDRMKIDRSLVAALDEEKGAGVLAATLSLARALHIPVTAEGVETREQADALTQGGCDQLQGYLVGKPMASKQLEELFLKSVA